MAKKAPTLRTNDAPAANDPAALVGHTVLLSPSEIGMTTNVRANPITEDEVKDLMRSMKQRQFQNVMVKPNTSRNNGDPRFIIVDGRNRLTAGLLAEKGNGKLGIKADPDFKIRAFVLPNEESKGNTDAIDTLRLAYSANTEVNHMTPLDQAHTYNTLRTQYKLDDAGARKVMGGFAPSWSNVLQRLLKITPEVREALLNGQLDARTAADVAVMDEAAQQRVLEAMDKAGAAKLKVITNAAVDPTIAQKAEAKRQADIAAKKAAKEKAAEEKAKARAAAKAKGQVKRGRKATKADLRTGAEIKAVFAELVGQPKLPKSLTNFCASMVEFIAKRSKATDMWQALYTLAGVETPPALAAAKANAASGNKTVNVPAAPIKA